MESYGLKQLGRLDQGKPKVKANVAETNAWLCKYDKLFLTACKIAGCVPTRRQYSKYRNGHGKAFGAKNVAKLTLEQANGKA